MSDVVNAAAEILAAAPCSVELPAGTGKTHLVAEVAALVDAGEMRTLILTHTHAGVDAIRRRLRSFKVREGSVRIETIASWAFSLAKAYRLISEIEIPDTPDWSKSKEYVAGATRVALSDVGRSLHRDSFAAVLVDEYQDCTIEQHEFVLAIAGAVDQTILFGDPLQGIFGFAGTVADWQADVLPRFPAFLIDPIAHRWRDTNPDLGQWLLDLRPRLTQGATLDFATETVPGLQWLDLSSASLPGIAHRIAGPSESVVILDKWSKAVVTHASCLQGRYGVMEELEGKFMRDALSQLPIDGDPALALWLARFAKDCFIGLGGIDAAVLKKLEAHESVGHYKREGLQDVLASLDYLCVAPSYAHLISSAKAMASTTGIRLYRSEAWYDTMEAIDLAMRADLEPGEALAKVRDRTRHAGRRTQLRTVSRTLLVKGLEFDHVIIADLDNFRDPQNLYVALSRARQTVTVLGRSSAITLT